MNIDSEEWRAVLKFIEKEEESAIKDLIADVNSDRQRGALSILEKLKKLPEPELQITQSDNYT